MSAPPPPGAVRKRHIGAGGPPSKRGGGPPSVAEAARPAYADPGGELGLPTDLALPLDAVEAVALAALPRGASIEPSAVAALAGLAAEFVAFLSSEAHAVGALRSQLSGEHSAHGAAAPTVPLDRTLQALGMTEAGAAQLGLIPQYGAVPELTVRGSDVVWAAHLLGFTGVAAALGPVVVAECTRQRLPVPPRDERDALLPSLGALLATVPDRGAGGGGDAPRAPPRADAHEPASGAAAVGGSASVLEHDGAPPPAAPAPVLEAVAAGLPHTGEPPAGVAAAAAAVEVAVTTPGDVVAIGTRE